MNYNIIIENRLIPYINLLHEGGIKGQVYKKKLKEYITYLCKEYNLEEATFRQIYEENYSSTKRKNGQSFDDDSDRKIRKNHNWNFIQL